MIDRQTKEVLNIFRRILLVNLIILALTILVFVPWTAAQPIPKDIVICSCSSLEPPEIGTHPNPNREHVTVLQEQLFLIGLNPGTIDGSFGPATQNAVRVFQILRGMKPTGTVTREVWCELYRVLGESSMEDVDPEARFSIVIDRGTRTLTTYVGNRFHRQYRVAVGTPETPTPLGEWKIVHRSTGWGSGFGTRWMGLNVPWGIYGVHGTNKPHSIGSYASHGCIRMFNQTVEQLYPMTKLGTPVTIIDSRYPKLPSPSLSKLRSHTSNQDMVFLQWRLKDLGIPITADGRYGPMTTWAVKYFQAIRCLPVTGVIDEPTFAALQVD